MVGIVPADSRLAILSASSLEGIDHEGRIRLKYMAWTWIATNRNASISREITSAILKNVV